MYVCLFSIYLTCVLYLTKHQFSEHHNVYWKEVGRKWRIHGYSKLFLKKLLPRHQHIVSLFALIFLDNWLICTKRKSSHSTPYYRWYYWHAWCWCTTRRRRTNGKIQFPWEAISAPTFQSSHFLVFFLTLFQPTSVQHWSSSCHIIYRVSHMHHDIDNKRILYYKWWMSLYPKNYDSHSHYSYYYVHNLRLTFRRKTIQRRIILIIITSSAPSACLLFLSSSFWKAFCVWTKYKCICMESTHTLFAPLTSKGKWTFVVVKKWKSRPLSKVAHMKKLNEGEDLLLTSSPFIIHRCW